MSGNSIRAGSGELLDVIGALSKAFSMVLVLSALAACQLAAQENGRPLHGHVAQSAANSGSSHSPRSTWKKGMAYAEFRNVATAAGWSAVVDPQCKANVIGENYAALCAAHAELDDCRVCDDLPELGACSSDGYCGMTFSKQTQQLRVTTYGMTDDRSVQGDKSRLQVVGWTIETKRP